LNLKMKRTIESFTDPNPKRPCFVVNLKEFNELEFKKELKSKLKSQISCLNSDFDLSELPKPINIVYGIDHVPKPSERLFVVHLNHLHSLIDLVPFKDISFIRVYHGEKFLETPKSYLGLQKFHSNHHVPKSNFFHNFFGFWINDPEYDIERKQYFNTFVGLLDVNDFRFNFIENFHYPFALSLLPQTFFHPFHPIFSIYFLDHFKMFKQTSFSFPSILLNDEFYRRFHFCRLILQESYGDLWKMIRIKFIISFLRENINFRICYAQDEEEDLIYQGEYGQCLYTDTKYPTYFYNKDEFWNQLFQFNQLF